MLELTWLGHAAFRIKSEGKNLFIDPWIKGNPASPFKSYKNIKMADLVFVTHDHNDHGFRDAVRICRRTGATFIGIDELTRKARRNLVRDVAGGNIGGEIEIKDIKVYFTPAWHSSKVGVPCGFIIRFHDYNIYHPGDTGFFCDMEYLGKLFKIDLMMVPICPRYMMGLNELVWAIEKLKPKIIVPMHYNTFPQIYTDFEAILKKLSEVTNIQNLMVNSPTELSGQIKKIQNEKQIIN